MSAPRAMGPAAAARSRLVCAACGAAPRADDPYPFRCPNADRGDGADHVLARTLDLARLAWPGAATDGAHPFVRYRTLLHAWHRALAGGLSDAEFVDLVGALDARVARLEGHGLFVTPLLDATELAARIGLSPASAWLAVKDETGNLAGSHKARHLFGLALHLEVSERLALTTRAESDRRGLAIASCGNAALAAATLARATDRPLTAFIPPDANPSVVGRLRELGARIAVCERPAGADGAGDPCVLAFRRALVAGALPFCCQGNENGLTIEGGMTLAWELADALAAAHGGRGPARLYVQVGGGALASAVAQGLAEAKALGALAARPRLHAVQTEGARPLARAYARVRARVLARLGVPAPAPPAAARAAGEAGMAAAATDPAQDAALAEAILPHAGAPALAEELVHARLHRALFMWPWEAAPHSVAHGILDDETYDWHAIVAAMLETGGFPVTAGEERLVEARDLARATTGVPVDATGAAGLAGLLELRARGVHRPGEPAAVLFTGRERA